MTDGSSPAGGGAPKSRPRRRGRPKSTTPNRDARVYVRVTAREKAGIEHEAKEAGLSASDYLRRRALDQPVEARVDAEARALLRRLGVNLNQLVRVAHRAGQVEHGDELGAVLAAVRAAVEGLGGEPPEAAREHPFAWHQG
ncbi:plasmid mobilization protein [Rubrivirga litoralis]|uniref:Mobilisation protein (MobC) n=1 Tax=Rubrivirga litoralis TaxID=3075598 RepID=A0ABU3BUI1_9BACT|nr:hypothetical protein [Rubrivirga sp. F394]MDT0632941.1 hypothetical protein [Rubrivirga sp. F394]